MQFVNVDKQENAYDCGLSAIAYATSLCHGDDVSPIISITAKKCDNT